MFIWLSLQDSLELAPASHPNAFPNTPRTHRPPGAQLLARALAQWPDVVHLNLSGNSIGDVGATELAVGLAAASRLASLDLSHNRIGRSVSSKHGSWLVIDRSSTSRQIEWALDDYQWADSSLCHMQ